MSIPVSRWLANARRLAELVPRMTTLLSAGIVDLSRPDKIVRILAVLRRLGPLAGAVTAARLRDGAAVAMIDENGPVTFDDFERRANALGRAWSQRGLGEGSVIAVLCRDHRGLVDAMLAAAKIGARVLLANTGFSGPQLADVAVRERVSALVYDEEFTELLSAMPRDIPRYLAWVDSSDPSRDTGDDTRQDTGHPVLLVEQLIADTDDSPLPEPGRQGGWTLLTSGTTGTPRGAARQVGSALVVTHFLERVPLHHGDVTFIATPMFHATGFSQLILNIALGSTIVVRRRFDAEATVRALAEHHCTTLVVVPTLLRRLLALGPEELARHDTSSLRVILTAGSRLAPEVSERTMDAFGDVLYNLYGSTEIAVATISKPRELRRAPGTVGRPPRGCRVRLYDANGRRITTPNVPGRIFVGSELAFTGYTGGGGKEIIDGLLCSGDVGHLDDTGLLFVDGRDDDMIVSGGENVFPAEVENLLLKHPDVADTAVVGVPDPEFGQRLRAFVVPIAGHVPTVDDIKKFVRANLARYKVPRDVVFMTALPRNETGKIRRKALLAEA